MTPTPTELNEFRQLQDGPVPEALAVRLAGHYAAGALDPLAQFYWTGRILADSATYVGRQPTTGVHSSSHTLDSHAVAAELRVLKAFFEETGPRNFVTGWLEKRWTLHSDYNLVVPWSWGR